MTILWCGGEDVDFPYGNGLQVTTSTSWFRSGYSRVGLRSTAIARSYPFTGGGVTSCWFSFYNYTNGYTNNAGYKWCGLSSSLSPTGFSGLYVGMDPLTNQKVALYKYNGSSWTWICSEPGRSVLSNSNYKFDVFLNNYGISATVEVYINGNLIISYSGDISISGLSSMDCISLLSYDATFASGGYMSEFIISDEDTRLLCIKTLAPSAAGDTNAWTGAYTDIDEISISDSDKIYSATNDADFQSNLTGMPSGTWSVKAVKIAARCVDGSGSTGIQLGVKSGGTVASGNTQTASGYWQTKERLMQVNPVTGVAFTPAEIEALQINLRAKTL